MPEIIDFASRKKTDAAESKPEDMTPEKFRAMVSEFVEKLIEDKMYSLIIIGEHRESEMYRMLRADMSDVEMLWHAKNVEHLAFYGDFDA